METTEKIKFIKEFFVSIVSRIEIDKADSLVDSSINAENIFLPIFSILFDTKTLINANSVHKNFPAVDYIDSVKQIAVQVTSQNTVGKIDKTINDFKKYKLNDSYNKLIIFILTMNLFSCRENTKNKWKTELDNIVNFDPESDILSLSKLLSLIRTQNKIDEVYNYLLLIYKKGLILDVEQCVDKLKYEQLNIEKRSAKYIPDIFVEIGRVKDHARFFSYPNLFHKYINEDIERALVSIKDYNYTLKFCGIYNNYIDLTEIENYIGKEIFDSDKLLVLLNDIKNHLNQNDKIFSKKDFNDIDEGKRYIYDNFTYKIRQSKYYWGLNIDFLLEKISALKSKIFIFKGKAGVGKTNFICDFVENFIIKYEIPYVYIGMSKIREWKSCDLTKSILNYFLENDIQSQKDALLWISNYAKSINKTFIFFMDGINEHDNFRVFNDQLKNFINEISEFDNIKLILTCRTEYFNERFGLFNENYILERSMIFEEQDRNVLYGYENTRIINSYFQYYHLNIDDLPCDAFQIFCGDKLALRFYCEAYGSTEKEIKDVSRNDVSYNSAVIFNLYLKKKIESSERNVSNPISSFVKSTSSRIMKMLNSIAAHMIEKETFTDVNIDDVITEKEYDIFTNILDEGLILKKNINEGNETISFTYDKFRDFILTKYILLKFNENGMEYVEEKLLKLSHENKTSIEGMYEFLFYHSKLKENINFYEYYKDHNSYPDLLLKHIEILEENDFTDFDKQIILDILSQNDYRSKVIIHKIIYKFHTHPYLFIMLINALKDISDENFEKIFEERSYFLMDDEYGIDYLPLPPLEITDEYLSQFLANNPDEIIKNKIFSVVLSMLLGNFDNSLYDVYKDAIKTIIEFNKKKHHLVIEALSFLFEFKTKRILGLLKNILDEIKPFLSEKEINFFSSRLNKISSI